MSSPGQVAYLTGQTVTVRLTATQPGRRATTATVTRVVRAGGVQTQDLTMPAYPFVGTLYSPADTGTRRPGVLVFGGSEGGDAGPRLLAEALADHGYPALAVAYFGAPGLPGTLVNIPLEYFTGAARWLAGQPGVDPARLTVLSYSRGSEAAELLGAGLRDLVHAVAVASPSSVVNPAADLVGSAWTRGGRPVPHVTRAELGQAEPPGDPAAVIPVGRIAGPVFLLCGTDDHLWPSCTYTAAMTQELGDHPHTVVQEPGAGHLVAVLAPDLPNASGRLGDQTYGGTVQADALARLDAWPKLLAFLTQE